ncbi:MAG TPA: hypothetical protein VJR89_15670, partial [Polyangiales bacterium]|nr:hypothetical protein [Polyangiales bacterium]
MDPRKTKRFWGKSPPARPDLPLPAANAEAGPTIDFAKTQVLPIEEIAKVLQTYRAEHKPPAFDLGRTQRVRASLRKPRVRARTWAAALALILIVAAHAVVNTEPATRQLATPET